MIYAVPSHQYHALHSNGTLTQIQDEVRTDNTAALAARVASGQLVQARYAERHAAGDRDRCYLCGDEVTPFHWTEKDVVYFMHLSNSDCIGNSANPRAIHQPAN